MAAKLSYEDVQALYRDHGPALLAYAAALLGDRATAEDVLHQVFLKLLGGRFEFSAGARPYLFRAVRNTALNQRRARVRDVSLGEDKQQWLVGSAENVEAGLALEQALRQLPVEQREVVVMHVWSAMTMDDIANVLDLSPNTVASRYRYGLNKLREIMQGCEADDEPGSR
jgi:RNA polymerase sigma-70 factor (ECF subfamily)